MSETGSGDLDHLPPHKRDMIRHLVRAIGAYIRERSRENAEKGARELGIGVGHFKKLVSVWEASRVLDRLPGAGRTKRKRIATREEQLAIIRSAIDAVPDAVTEEVVRVARRIAIERGMDMPSPVTMRARVKELRTARRPQSFGSDADLVVDHCAIGDPVRAPIGDARMPVAAVVIDVSSRRIVGVSLSLDGPDTRSTLFALAAALRTVSPSADGGMVVRPPRIAIDPYDGPEWQHLTEILRAEGAIVTGATRDKLRRGVAAPFIGEKVNGLSLHPRLASRPPTQRHPSIASGQTPMSLAEAQTLIEAVLSITSADVCH